MQEACSTRGVLADIASLDLRELLSAKKNNNTTGMRFFNTNKLYALKLTLSLNTICAWGMSRNQLSTALDT